MFLNNQTEEQQSEYIKLLKLIGQLSNLFSDSKTPFLYYRVAEKIFCKAFSASDLSRSDVSADAMKNGLGIGLKTYLAGNNKTFQKVAEFNGDKNLYDSIAKNQIPYKIAELRNKRIELTHNLFDIKKSIYHSVVRENGAFALYEEDMNYIDIDKIRDIKVTGSSIRFNDENHEYSFLLSKSTLTKRFLTSNSLTRFDVSVIDDPLTMLEKCLNGKQSIFSTTEKHYIIFLPLYGKNKIVFEKSGLNQWNAKGRKRDYDEIYIPIPALIHKKYPDFFFSIDEYFDLILPDGKILVSKVCQDGSKALMSQSNRELGNWLLRKVLNIKEGELLTYLKLQIIGVDAVRIDKIDNYKFEINFAACGSYENFLLRNVNK